MTQTEFRRRFHLPLNKPFNFFAVAIMMLIFQLIFARFEMTNLTSLIAIGGVIFLMFLVWIGLRVQFKNRLYTEFVRLAQSGISFEDFSQRLHLLLRR